MFNNIFQLISVIERPPRKPSSSLFNKIKRLFIFINAPVFATLARLFVFLDLKRANTTKTVSLQQKA
jgi:hypothetical protein